MPKDELNEPDEELEDGELEDELEDDDEDEGDDLDEEQPAAQADEDDDDSNASLEELLAQRSAARRGTDDADDDDDIMALATEHEPLRVGSVATKVIPIKDAQEFVCRRCFLVKARSQLADAERTLCRDCV